MSGWAWLLNSEVWFLLPWPLFKVTVDSSSPNIYNGKFCKGYNYVKILKLYDEYGSFEHFSCYSLLSLICNIVHKHAGMHVRTRACICTHLSLLSLINIHTFTHYIYMDTLTHTHTHTRKTLPPSISLCLSLFHNFAVTGWYQKVIWNWSVSVAFLKLWSCVTDERTDIIKQKIWHVLEAKKRHSQAFSCEISMFCILAFSTAWFSCSIML